jgi:hypothetical protein
MSDRVVCQAVSCICEVAIEVAVQHEGRYFCSERCAEHRGCDHAGCNCGKFPSAEPSSPELEGNPTHDV